MLPIHMLRDSVGMPDDRGDRKIYPKAWTGEADDEFAIYAVSMGYAKALGDWPEPSQLSALFVTEIVKLFRAVNVEPTQAEVTAEVAAQLAAMAAQQPAAGPGAEPTAESADAPPAGGQAKPRRKVSA